jgi:hypothetical protein
MRRQHLSSAQSEANQKPSIFICSAYRSQSYLYAWHYKAEHKNARQYNANRRNLLVTPGAASFEPLKLNVWGLKNNNESVIYKVDGKKYRFLNNYFNLLL